ncbi:MAG: TetR/AcrR family transcriptional regulator [Pseudomonadota bacterium]
MADQALKKRGRGRPRLDAGDGRDDIKRAALTEFARHGFKGTGIDQIAARAGVAKRLIHYHFGSKEALWQQAVSEAYDEFRGEAVAFVQSQTRHAPEDTLDAFATQIVRFAAARVSLIQISIDETRQGGERADWLMATYLVPLQRLMIGQTAALVGGPSETDAESIASHLIPSMFGAVVFPFIDADVTAKAHGVDVFDEAYIAGQAEFIKGLLRACLVRYRL